MSPWLIDASSLLYMIKNRGKALKEKREIIILPLTIYEIGNALRTEAYIRNSISPKTAEALLKIVAQIIERLETLGLEADDPVRVLSLAGRRGLTFYDASYLYSAKKTACILVTEDKKLAKEASEEGVEVVSAANIK